MNLTRWSARLPGGQRRASAAPKPPAPPQPVRRGGAGTPGSADAPPVMDLPEQHPEPDAPAAHDRLTVKDVLGHLPALVAVGYGPNHRIGYLNRAYTDVFGPRPTGVPAHQAMPELDELGLLPLMDQAFRTGRARTVKARKVTHSSPTSTDRPRFYTFVCAPVRDSEDLGRQLDALAEAHQHHGRGAVARTPLGPLSTLGPLGALRRSSHAADVCGVLVFGAEVTDQVQATERLRESERRHREAAVTLQRSLLPQKLEQPDDLRVAATYQPGGPDAAVGGDWYDVITLGGGRTALVIGDVMGRGMRAAAVMGQLRTAVRAYARLDLPPHEVLQLLDGLASEIDPTLIATCVYAVYDPSEQLLTYSSAGHLPLMIREPDGSVTRPEEPCGPPLGTGGWLHTSASVSLITGATGVLYTDGLVERRGQDIDEGLDALATTFAGATGQPDVICARLLRAMGVTPDHDDDVAALVFQLPERDSETAELFRGASLELLGGAEAVSSARAFTSGVLASWRLGEELLDLGVLAVSELVSNSFTHGHPPMRLRLRRTDRRLTVEVTDADDHLPRRRQAAPADESGRGIAIIATIASSWGTRRTPDGGKAVWCDFLLPAPRQTPRP
ncbi:SpoIIE family protein phosphatase [Streptacidiphilus sp. PB12-B1b]|uniref:ATP-binding SpoIIE family protein phosphatase n=1 Tax=Streptacidiphilus sp. PB12-B1b TaxID=2705012 RepID=UPI001CDC166D|nr:SpoIIE family protein phosphatase [Streptacidiphilus sp. PB12-B1b]QMU79655.1 SpoIIE family protein phosphatase [Streptacidiphilus sp. PB12-B1b]